MAFLVLLTIGWSAYTGGYIGDYIGDEVKIFEVSSSDAMAGKSWPRLAQVWDFEKKADIDYQRGGWRRVNFSQSRLKDGFLTAYIYGDSYMRVPKSVVKTLRTNKNKLVYGSNGSSGKDSASWLGYKLKMRLMLKNPLVIATSALETYKEDEEILPETTQVYDKIEGKLVIYGRQRQPLKREVDASQETAVSYGNWGKNGVLKEIPVTAEKVTAGQFFEMEFDLGEIDPESMQVSAVRWYPLMNHHISDDLRMLSVSYADNKFKRPLYQLRVDSISFWLTRGEGAPEEELLKGGDEDEYGCKISTGYSYNETVGACIRSWELSEREIEVAALAAKKLGKTYGLVVIQVTEMSVGTDIYQVVLRKYNGTYWQATVRHDKVTAVKQLKKFSEISGNICAEVMVCGEDSQTYSTVCAAEEKGVTVKCYSECPCE